MKRNLNVVLLNLDKSPITEAMVEPLVEGKEVVRKVTKLTLAAVATSALLANHQDERDLSGTDKVTRYKLAQRINDADREIEMSAEEVTLLKTLIGKAYAPLVVGQAFDLLERDPYAASPA